MAKTFGLKDGLADLLDSLAKVKVGDGGVRWLRFLYAYPNKITGRLLDTIARHDNICKYLDVPLQHASGNVLKRMKRGANADIFLKTIEKVRAAVPGIALRTSFIVGFPGETEQDFTELMDFVREAKFDWMGAFSYSDEDGSKSFHLGEKVATRSSTTQANSHAPAEDHQQKGQTKVGRPAIRSVSRERIRRDAAPVGRPNPIPRTRDRWQGLHQ